MVKTKNFLVTAALATVALYGCDTTPESAPDTGTVASAAVTVADRSADADAIRQLDETWLKWAMAKNVDSMLALYSPDAHSFNAGQKPITDMEARRKANTEYVSMNPRDASLKNLGVHFSDDGTMATSFGTYEQTLTMGGKDMKEQGSYLSVLKRTPAGWRYIADISNSSMPIGAPPPA